MIKKPFSDKVLAEELEKLAPDRREIFLAADNGVRISAVSATETVNQARENFSLGPMEAMVLSQGYIAGALLSSEVKGNDRIQLTVECGGPIGGLYIESWACGAVRGYLKNDVFKVPEGRKNISMDELYGPGFLSVTKLLEGEKQPFTGQIMMQYGSLAEDLALYYMQSEQTPSLFALSVHFDEAYRINGAGGLFIQALPGCTDEVLARLEEKSKHLPHIGKYLSEGKSIKEFVEENFKDEKAEHIGSAMVGFSCPCSKENFQKHLAGLPADEKKAILENGPFPLELSCLNCGSVYSFDKEELERILK